MTATTAEQGGRVIPGPLPPTIDTAQEGSDYRHDKGLLDHLWDVIAVHGPGVSRDTVKQHASYRGSTNNWREYARFHQNTVDKNKHTPALLATADEWVFDYEIGLGIFNGYLIEKDGLLSTGQCPPTHTPLGTISTSSKEEDIAAAVAKQVSGNQAEARDILMLKLNPTRMKTDPKLRQALKKSLVSMGQLEPITMWQPFGYPKEEAIVVNGATRKEILEGLGIEPIITWLPTNTPATEVLARRIHHELFATSKPQTTEVRDDYIVELLARKVDWEEITKMVGVSRMTISRVFSRQDVKDRVAGRREDLISQRTDLHKEWRDLYATGDYRYEDLAKIYKVHLSTIKRNIDRIITEEEKTAKAASSTSTSTEENTKKEKPANKPKKPRRLTGLAAKGIVALYTKFDEEGATSDEVFLPLNSKGGRVMDSMAERGLVKIVGKGGKSGTANLWWVTEDGIEEAQFHIDALPPDPKPEPKPPTPTPPNALDVIRAGISQAVSDGYNWDDILEVFVQMQDAVPNV